MINKRLLSLLVFFCITLGSSAQVNENKTGAWYMYFWNTTFKESNFGVQGDLQYRGWNFGSDLDQILLRGGLTFAPDNTDIKLTAGYAHITSGVYGESKDTFLESRIYQEALMPQKYGRFFITHRLRYEQRWVEDQDFRTRYRYNLFLNIPFNQSNLNEGAVYLALYNEIFINGQKDIGGGNGVEFFDRNRFYTAMGYSLKNNLRIQLGYLEQTTNSISKGQVQLSLHHTL